MIDNVFLIEVVPRPHTSRARPDKRFYVTGARLETVSTGADWRGASPAARKQSGGNATLQWRALRCAANPSGIVGCDHDEGASVVRAPALLCYR